MKAVFAELDALEEALTKARVQISMVRGDLAIDEMRWTREGLLSVVRTIHWSVRGAAVRTMQVIENERRRRNVPEKR